MSAKPSTSGEAQVTHRYVVRLRSELTQCGRGALHGIDSGAPVLEGVPHELENVRVIVDLANERRQGEDLIRIGEPEATTPMWSLPFR